MAPTTNIVGPMLRMGLNNVYIVSFIRKVVVGKDEGGRMSIFPRGPGWLFTAFCVHTVVKGGRGYIRGGAISMLALDNKTKNILGMSPVSVRHYSNQNFQPFK